MRLQPETEIVHRMAIWVHKENCNVHAWRKWASFAVAIRARVRFMSWITAKALSGGCCTNRKQHQWIDGNRRDMKSKTGKSQSDWLYGSLSRSSCQTTILTQSTRLSTPRLRLALRHVAALMDNQASELLCVSYIWMENLWKCEMFLVRPARVDGSLVGTA